jgi:uncharacterized protein YecT (DUF1311 family)
MKRALITAFAILIPVAAAGATAEEKYQTCLDTSFDMKGCTVAENERLDPILKAAYQAALTRETQNRDRLAAVQRA